MSEASTNEELSRETPAPAESVADSQESEVTKSEEPGEGRSRGKSLREWTAFATGILGGILGILGFVEARNARDEARAAVSISRQSEAEQHLGSAWDLMGGEPGTISISQFASPRSLELARRDIKQALLRLPDSPKAHRYFGVYLKGIGKLDEAVAAYRRSIELDPQSALTFNNLANALFAQGKHADAFENYDKAIELAPNDPLLRYNRGVALAETKQLPEAIKSFREAVQLDAGFAEGHSQLADTLFAVGNLEEAVATYRVALELAAGDAIVRNNFGNTLRVQGKYEEAAKELRRAIALDSTFAQAHFNLGVVLQELGQDAEAEAAFETARRLADWELPINVGKDLLP